MGKYSRRDFLKMAAAGAGIVTLNAVLDACGQILPTTSPLSGSPTDSGEQLPAPSLSPLNPAPDTTDTFPAPTDTPLTIPDMVVTRGGEPELLVRQAVGALGGMGKFVPSGANVVI